MEVNVTMTEQEYEEFRIFKQLNKKEYLESQIKENYSLLECLHLYGITYEDGTGHAEFYPSTNITKVAVHCESPRTFRGGITVDITESFKDYQDKKGSQWLRASELKELGVDLED